MANKKLISNEQSRCRRCDRPLSNPNDTYGWRCAEIIGALSQDKRSYIDGSALKMYSNSERDENFTVKEEDYTNTFIKEKEDTKREVYTVISDLKILGEDLQVEYKIDKGVVRFDFENNDDYWSIMWRGGGKKLAKAIYNAGKTLSSDNLFGRTVDGINTELQLHWAMYKAGIMEKNTKIADIGGMKL